MENSDESGSHPHICQEALPNNKEAHAYGKNLAQAAHVSKVARYAVAEA